ncbi:MAG TPA: iron-containing alcohol dehydrogenase [Acidobacteriota bacterium]|nr:iron-containing alcohol dehydrogenase [Acidobacteriota bacterium]
MQNFRLSIPTTMVVGPGQFSTLGEEAAAIGKKVLVVTGRSSARRTGLLDRAVDLLNEAGVESVVFGEIEPNPRHTTCDRAAEIARAEGCDVIVALGGGSPMDAAKAIAASAVTGRSCWDFVNRVGGRAEISGALPIIAVPTTAATGSEADAGAVITNWETNEKCPMFSLLTIPAVAILDPELHLSLPPDVTADGCVDILSHYLESYLAGEGDCGVQDRITEGLMNVVFEWGPVAYRDGSNLRARRELQYASTWALTGLPNKGRGGAWPMHAIEHALSGHYDIAHGRGLAIVIPRIMRFVHEAVPNRYAQFGTRCFGIPQGNQNSMAKAAIDAFVTWLESLDRNLTLGDVGIGEEKFEVMAEDVLRNYGDGRKFDYVVELDKKAIIEILGMCRKPN